MRADAERNRSEILTQARRLIAEHGDDVTMDDIADATGLAVGTLYRHYPTKADLVAAVVAESIDQIATAAQRAADDVDGGASAATTLDTLLHMIVDRSNTDRAVKHAAASLGAELPDLDAPADSSSAPTATARALAAVGHVLEAAQRSGEIRDDITVADLLLIVEAVPATAGTAGLERYLDIVVRGLRVNDRRRR